MSVLPQVDLSPVSVLPQVELNEEGLVKYLTFAPLPCGRKDVLKRKSEICVDQQRERNGEGA